MMRMLSLHPLTAIVIEMAADDQKFAIQKHAINVSGK